jgi:hypothetical protein
LDVLSREVSVLASLPLVPTRTTLLAFALLLLLPWPATAQVTAP